LPWEDIPENFFHEKILKKSEDSTDVTGFLSWPVLVALTAVWFITYWCVFIESISKLTKWIASLGSLLSLIMMLVILFRSVAENGSSDGLLQLFRPDWSMLSHGELWLGAFGQICFTFGIANGSMTMFASHYGEGKDTIVHSWVVMIMGIIFSMIGGLTYYAVLGYVAFADGVQDVNAVFRPGIGSPIFLLFEAITKLLPAPHFFSAFLMLSFILLGFNSIFYFVESIIDMVTFSSRRKSRRFIVAMVACSVCFLSGTPYTLSNGYYILQIVDHYVGNYVLALIAMMECIGVGYYASNPEGGKIKSERKPIINLFKNFKQTLKEFAQERSLQNLNKVIFFSIRDVRNRFERETLFGPWILWAIVIKFLAPILLCGLLVWNLVFESIRPFSTNPKVDEYDFLSLALGWLLVFACILVFIIFGVWSSVEEKEEVGGDDMKEFVNSISRDDLKQPLTLEDDM